jgi:hypothetical protein
MLTTDGPACSTRSVKSGKVRTCAAAGASGSKTAEAVKAQALTQTSECNFFKKMGFISDAFLKI